LLEGPYKTKLTETIYSIFGSRVLVVRLDAGLLQGAPDMLLLFEGGFWAALEAKTNARAKKQPNQPYYIDLMDQLSFAAFIFPENEEAVLNELEQKYETHWAARLS
jgi:hypothetical protein